MSFKTQSGSMRMHREWNLFVLRDRGAPPLEDAYFLISNPLETGVVPADVLAVRNLFVSYLSSYGIVTFEGFTPLGTDLEQANGVLTGDLAGTVNVLPLPNPDPEFPPYLTVRSNPGVVNGRYNTNPYPGGTYWIELSRGAFGQTIAKFTPSILTNGFGFYLTDVNDVLNTVTITVNTDSGSLSYPVPLTPVANGHIVFFGQLLADRVVQNVVLEWTNSADVIGCDGILIGYYT